MGAEPPIELPESKATGHLRRTPPRTRDSEGMAHRSARACTGCTFSDFHAERRNPPPFLAVNLQGRDREPEVVLLSCFWSFEGRNRRSQGSNGFNNGLRMGRCQLQDVATRLTNSYSWARASKALT